MSFSGISILDQDIIILNFFCLLITLTYDFQSTPLCAGIAQKRQL